MGREPERAGGHRFVIRQCRRANDDVATRARCPTSFSLSVSDDKLKFVGHSL